MNRWIGVAVLDWSDEAFSSFYPSDIPEDWRLTWLANVAMAVVVSPTYWQTLSAETASHWLEQTQENFWFYLLCDTPEQCASAEQIAGYFPRQFAGIVTRFTVESQSSPFSYLTLGKEVLPYQSNNLRKGQVVIRSWLSEFQGDHGVILLEGEVRQQIRELQSLLSLLGVMDE